MKTSELSTCFCTNDIEACSEFYQQYFAAKVVFDCGWYVNLRIGEDGPSIQFMQPQNDMPVFSGKGITLNFRVDDVDAEHTRLTEAGLGNAMPLEDHPWGDRGFPSSIRSGTLSIFIPTASHRMSSGSTTKSKV